MPKEKWIDIQGWDVMDSGRVTGIAVDPSDPNVHFSFDDLAVPAVQTGVDGRDFLQWQRGQAPAGAVAMEEIVVAHEGLDLI